MQIDPDELNHERLCATQLSAYADFGMINELETMITNQQTFFKDRINDNKNEIVRAFASRNFDVIHPLTKKNDRLSVSGFQQAVSLAKTVTQCNKNSV